MSGTITPMPFTCEACGQRRWPHLLPAVGTVLRCPDCGDERSFSRPPLLIVTGTAGVGKSTLCARLAGTVRGAVLLDADIFADEHVSVIAPNEDYPAFWHSMIRLGHELAQNAVVPVFFSTMLPMQLLANREALTYFASVQFLVLSSTPDVLRTRLARREGAAAAGRLDFWLEFHDKLAAEAAVLPEASVVDAGCSMHQLERAARDWIVDIIDGWNASLPPSTLGR